MSELHPISGICTDPARKDQRKADVVFIHGLMGDPFETWRHGEAENKSWPHWLANDFQDIGVWTLEYAALPSHWLMDADGDRAHSMPIMRRATEVLQLLSLKLGKRRPLVLVCHSLGGLLAKEVIRQSSDSLDDESKSICERTAAVMFLATPHQGAGMARVASKLSMLLRASENIRDLEAHSPQLANLYDWYRQHSPRLGIATSTFFENEYTKGVWLVNSTTANPGVGPAPVPLDADHIEIAKPREPDALVCLRLNQIIGGILERVDVRMPASMTAQASHDETIKILNSTIKLLLIDNSKLRSENESLKQMDLDRQSLQQKISMIEKVIKGNEQ